ncbi:GGDEF domain-containing protein [Stakelama sediminis]|uniref:diguanylate cyclase n=1 Tax=Stakelama sediminis TaxID=463200 RepID=A0A840YY16_9SPHN|nr:GGDEF domain-containing protein [Stakelama sediminis]MBB5718414.1 diguanylate cyclase [Stakelama sediminis]
MFAGKTGTQSTKARAVGLYEQIGLFLEAQHLEPNPANYTFAYAIHVDPDGGLACAVRAMTDDGIRLSQRDVESLGHTVDPNRPAQRDSIAAEGLMAETQMRVEGFMDMVGSMHRETSHFGRDLQESAAAMGEAESPSLNEIAQLTAKMIKRVDRAEARMEVATREAQELRAKLEEARADATHDPLTCLPNRRAIENAYAQTSQQDQEVWLAICDIDYFKTVNDRFGHAVGDRVLKAIAGVLKEECDGHVVARYGGEEFAILLSGVDLAQAKIIMERAREKVAAKRYRLRETDAPLGEVTFSAGLTPAQPGEAWDDVYRRADSLLYIAKEEGRNRVTVENAK